MEFLKDLFTDGGFLSALFGGGSIGIIGLLVVYRLVKKAVVKVSNALKLTYEFFREYQDQILAVFVNPKAKKDLRSWLEAVDEATEAIADVGSKFKFIPKQVISYLRELIKMSNYNKQ